MALRGGSLRALELPGDVFWAPNPGEGLRLLAMLTAVFNLSVRLLPIFVPYWKEDRYSSYDIGACYWKVV